MSQRKKIGEILVDQGNISAAQVDHALEQQKSTKGKRLGQVLLNEGAIDDVAVARALGLQLGVPWVDPLGIVVDGAAVWKLPRKLAEQHRALVYGRVPRGFKVVWPTRATPPPSATSNSYWGAPFSPKSAPRAD
jgi:MSHA biogenesis protein MshE